MAKTIMIANKVYEELKEMKEDKSFSEAIRALMERKSSKTGSSLRACLGRLERTDAEYESSRKSLRKEYAKWNKRYA
ncbi:MAG TPA: antitoxin VapB family protein [Candidatus Nanoarchaeia archaeon]|nr:antitoxin VapB family protein [Candidatus Nanoarchaeia archaeon]